jgi:hypothetical protein
MAVANTLAYYVSATITAVKSFIVQAPGFRPIKIRHYTNSQLILFIMPIGISAHKVTKV